MKSQEIRQDGAEGVWHGRPQEWTVYRFITTKNELSGFLIDSAFLRGGKWNI